LHYISMAREATKIELTNSTGNIRQYTCADGTGIAKGTLLKLTDPRTASVADAATSAAACTAPCAGIAAEEKVASDGATQIAVYTDGIFKATASNAAIAVGEPLVFVGNNYVMGVAALGPGIASGAAIVGYALETAAAGETFQMRLRL
jgi:hypothetical protein